MVANIVPISVGAIFCWEFVEQTQCNFLAIASDFIDLRYSERMQKTFGKRGARTPPPVVSNRRRSRQGAAPETASVRREWTAAWPGVASGFAILFGFVLLYVWWIGFGDGTGGKGLFIVGALAVMIGCHTLNEALCASQARRGTRGVAA